MATSTNLSGVYTTDIDNSANKTAFVSTENVVGLIFDTAIVGGVDAALKESEAAKAMFANGNVVELNVEADIAKAGIDDTVLEGVALYHLNTFFNIARGQQRIFVSFMDSSKGKDEKFSAIENMQLAANGIIYQIGVWTGEAAAKLKNSSDSEYATKYDVSELFAILEKQAETLGGAIGKENYEGNAPLNILVSAPVLNQAEVKVEMMPDFTATNCPKVTYVMGQEASEAVHDIMFKVNHKVAGKTSYVPVGCIGAALGCLALAPANQSIGHVKSFNLGAIFSEAELGFGKLVDETPTGEGAKAAHYDKTSSFNNIKTLNYNKRNFNLHKNGVVFLRNYDGLEGSVFFSCDQTLSTGDFRSISRCRVMHKSRRIVRNALLSYVNGNLELDASSGTLLPASVTLLQNLINSSLDTHMVEPGTKKPQISGRVCAIDNKQNVLESDKLDISYNLVPLGVSGVMWVTESFVSSNKK